MECLDYKDREYRGANNGKLLEGKTPKEISDLKICDPACGSVSFLLGAYQYLLDWHRDYYVAEDPEKWAKPVGRRAQTLYQVQGGEWRLTTVEKRRILLNNIFGVDIDPKAVEVTKLSLLLKVLEGENEGILIQQLAFFQQRALPDLDTNIKCSNSLIGPDYYSQKGRQLAFLDTEEMYRINPFDWIAEFPKIMTAGGFDAIIGNPPYIRMEEFKELKGYLKEKFHCHNERVGLEEVVVGKLPDWVLRVVEKMEISLEELNEWSGSIPPVRVELSGDGNIISIRAKIPKKRLLAILGSLGALIGTGLAFLVANLDKLLIILRVWRDS